MAKLTAAQVYSYARGAGFSPSDAVVATAIARAESKFETTAVGDTALANKKWGPSIGLWQVRSLNAERGKGTTRDATRLTDPAVNAQSAYAIYKAAGSTFTDWSTYNDRAYVANLSEAKSVAGTAATVGVPLPTSTSSGGGAMTVTPASLFGNTTAADPVSWAGSITSGLTGDLTDGLTDAATGGLSALWQQVQPFLVTAGVAGLGLALVGAGIVVTAWPSKQGAS